MARTPSNMLALGTKAPDFELIDTISDKYISLQQIKSDKATVVMFICNHCPYVKNMQEQLVQFAKDYQRQGVNIVAINSNDAEHYPEDAPDKMLATAKEFGYTFPYLYDETQEIAKAYEAACTPDFYIFDKDLKCVYRGQFDDSRPGNGVAVTGKDMRAALDEILAGKAVSAKQVPSLGCNIKWK